ncbi:MAG: hypothetical protein FWH55_03470 [Oscillospiraceae bacterium]|nr:hypothetical protein [Oscillospiraceae bacterium]
MRSLKKFLAVLLTIAMMVSAAVPAFATPPTAPEQLGIIGLLQGSGEGLTEEYLNTNLTRMQVAILYARLIGIEEEAYEFEDWDYDSNFADCDDRTSPVEENMLGFFYDDPSYGFIGTDMDTALNLMKFEPQATATNKQLVKILLTAMGYPFGTGYDWDTILSYARDIGLSAGSSEVPINMYDVAELIVMALESKMPDGTVFGQYLIDEGILDEDLVAEAGINLTGEPVDEEGAGPEPDVYEAKSIAANNFAEVEITMNYAIDPGSVDKANIRVDGSKLASGDKAYVVDDVGEGAILRIFCLDGFVSAQNERREISVTGLKTPSGNTMTPFVQEVMFRDSTAPTIEAVIAKGNSRLDIFLSEPLQESSSINSLSNYNIDGKRISGSAPVYDRDQDKNTGRVISIKKINTVLAAGTYELSINGVGIQVLDYAGNNMGFQSSLFTIVDDKEGPIAEGPIDPVYPAKVRIQFDEEITEDGYIYWLDGGARRSSSSTSVDDDDPTIAIFEFDGSRNSKVLPFAATTIYLQDVTDYSGNAAQAPLSFQVTPVPDSVRPEVVDYGSDEEGMFWVQFSKSMASLTSYSTFDFVIYNGDGDRVYDVAAVNGDDDDKIEFSHATELGADTYEVTLKKFQDKALPDPNELLETKFEVRIPDTYAPDIESAWWSDDDKNIINIFFSERVDPSSALYRSNYKTAEGDRGTTSLPSVATISLASGDRLVRIDVSRVSSTDRAKMKFIVVSDVQDLDGNVMSMQRAEILAIADVKEAEVSYTAATAEDRIRIYISDATSGIVSYDPGDFTLYTGKTGSATSRVGITNASLNSDRNELTLTLNRKLSADGTYDGYELWLGTDYLNPAVGVDPTTYQINSGDTRFLVQDRIEPTLVDVLWGLDSGYGSAYTNRDAITLVFDEKVQPDTGKTWDDLFLTLDIDGETVTNGDPGYAWHVDSAGPDADGYYFVNIFMTGTKNIESVDVDIVHRPMTTWRINDGSTRPGGPNYLAGFTKTVNVRFMH